ncbi:MAG: pilus assembly protein PilM [Thermoguttaceae bacterium]
MAKTEAVWGIDIGNCALKALRCRPAERPDRVIADAFDYIEYPKILTQPGAEPSELVHEALQQFLSRNSLRGDRIAISVSGQAGLARFVKLPPVESKKIPDIVRFEARQQIPFDLNDVIWDYQRMGGGMEESGFLLETEIGLFAMKRDQVFRALEPLTRVGIEVDIVQLTPLALYNFMCFDQLEDLPPPDEYDPDNPPPSTVVLSMGTDATDLVVTNGFRVWQRSIPVGGNHFTKALTKELKLTFAKAEHLKRNAATAEDPKAVFQAMRPVFNDLLTEVQRSLGYFSSLDRAAKIERVIGMGNGIKLPGLRRYLSQSLGIEVVRLESFRRLDGPEVLNAPAFQENQLCFPVCYGIALQGLKKAPLRTNLLPKEIIKDRLIDSKRPWAVACAAVLLLACAVGFVSHVRAWSAVHPDKFKEAQREAKTVAKMIQDYKRDAEAALAQFESTDKVGVNVVEGIEGRLRWLELLKAINANLPRDIPNPDGSEKDISERNQIHIRSIDCQRMENFEAWMREMRQRGWFKPTPEELADDPALAAIPGPGEGGTAGSDSAAAAASGGSASAGLMSPSMPSSSASGSASEGGSGTGESGGAAKRGIQGPGWLIQIVGYHFHNRDIPGVLQGAEYVRRAFLDKLRNGKVFLPVDPADPNSRGEWFALKDLGIRYPVLVAPGDIHEIWVENPLIEPSAPPGYGPGTMGPRMPGAQAMPGMPSAGGMSRPGMVASGSTSMPKMPPMPGGMGSMAGMATGATPGYMPSMPKMPSMSGGMGSMGGMATGATPGYMPSMPTTMPKMPSMPGYGPRGPSAPGAPRMPGGMDEAGAPTADNLIKLRVFEFRVQFIWQPVSPSERLEKLKAKQEASGPEGEGPAAPAGPAPGGEQGASEGTAPGAGPWPVPGHPPAQATPPGPRGAPPAAPPVAPAEPGAAKP